MTRVGRQTVPWAVGPHDLVRIMGDALGLELVNEVFDMGESALGYEGMEIIQTAFASYDKVVTNTYGPI